jgi:DNA-binding MarR family transcriptional regulator
MNNKLPIANGIPPYQLEQFQELIGKLFQCCQERIKYQCERFDLPDAELRCLKLFDRERYLTAKGISRQMNVVKSRITKIIDGLSRKGFVQRVKDPEDSRITLLSLTPAGQAKMNEINGFMEEVHLEVLNRMPESQRTAVLSNLELLRSAMQSVKEMMT